MSLTGTWDLRIWTPVGMQSALLELIEHEGIVAGVAKYDAETLPLINPVLHDKRLTWQLSISKLRRLQLTFDVTSNGDTLTSTSKTAILPLSRVTGMRVPEK